MHTRPNHSAGFTFPELLIALGIFALGFVTVGAIFPTAIMLQKRTIQAVESEALGKSAKAMLQAMPWDKADLDADPDFGTNTTEVLPLDDERWDNWPLASRALLSDQYSLPEEAETFWVPLLWDSDADPANTDWTAFVFTLRRSPTVQNYEAAFSAPDWTIANPDPIDPVNIPKVVRRNNLTGTGTGFTLNNAERWLDIGDPVLISTGETGNVTNIDGDNVEVDIVGLTSTISVWFAPKPSENQSSPGREIITVTGVAR